MKFNKKLSLFSIIAVIVVSFIPVIGIKVVNEVFRTYYFGFPARWLGFHLSGGGQLSFQVFNLIFNFFFFYSLFWVTKKIAIRIKEARVI
ncbi:hypothetical protein F6Y05_38415 [Bacillus megaterium]|nr:hypothetical protein [Priestia megaterium]